MNETLLRQALTDIADDVDTFNLVTPALRHARRVRFVQIVLTPIAVLLVAALLVVAVRPLAAPIVPARSAPSPTSFGIPERIDVPRWARKMTNDPPGRVAAVFGGPSFAFVDFGDNSRIGSIGPAGYRMSEHWWSTDEVHVGEEILLSADGTQLAWLEKSLRIVDFATGQSRYLPLPNPGRFGTAGKKSSEILAWSPDGRWIAVAEVTFPPSESKPVPDWVSLNLIDVKTGEYRRLASVTGKLVRGHGLAFSADGQRIAYQGDNRLFVIDLNGNPITSSALDPGAILAGKGAWTPDGSAIAVAVPKRCCTPVTTDWALRFITADTGQPAANRNLPAVNGATAVRLLGWSASTRAVLVAFRPERGPMDREPSDDRTSFGNVRGIDLLSLEPGKQPEVLFKSPGQVLTIDIADQAIASGVIVPAPPQSLIPPADILRWAGLVTAIVYILMTSAVFLTIQMVRRGRRSSTSGLSPTG